MAFGFFGGNDDADIIYTNCTVHTMDDALPLAQAVACKDGRILRVGSDEDMEDIVGDETDVFDLEGMHVFPGFIDAQSSPVLDVVDEDVCYVIDESENIDQITVGLEAYIAEEPMAEIYFGYGFDPALIVDMELEERQSMLDEICPDKPVLLLSEDGFTGWFNTAAFEEVEASAEEDGMEILTLPYMLSVLAPVDPEKLESSAFEVIQGYCREGYTSVFEGSVSTFLSSMYEELLMMMLSQGNLPHRYISGIYICRETEPSYIDMQLQNHKSRYAELNGEIFGGIVSAHVSGENLSQDYIVEMMKAAAARQGNVILHAEDSDDVSLCRQAVDVFRQKAGGKIHISLLHDEDPSYYDTHKEFFSMQEGGNAAEEIRIRTVVAAEKLAIDEDFGSITEGKFADFAVFENDISAGELVRGELPDASMTIIGGEIAYDCEDDPDSLWQLSVNEQIW